MNNYNDYEKLLKLGKDVVPKPWNVYQYRDFDSQKKDKLTLNIELRIYDARMARIARNNNNAGAHVKNIESLNGAGYVTINLYNDSVLWTQSLLHELAHIAVHRLSDLRMKSYRRGYSVSNSRIIEPCSHGKIFYKYLEIFEKRAIKNGWNFLLLYKKKIWYFGDPPGEVD
jgi:hypothetical protein